VVSRRGGQLHSGAEGPVRPAHRAPRQRLRHDRHGYRAAGHARAGVFAQQERRPYPRRHGHRRNHRRDRRAAGADDADARACRRDAFLGRPRRGIHRRRRGQQPGRDGSRRADHRRSQGGALHRNIHRRDHLLRLGDRLWQIVGPDPQRARGVQGSAFRQSRHRHRHDRIRHLVLRGAARDALDAVHHHDGARVPARISADHSHRRRGHAGGDLDAQQLFRMGGGGYRLLARQPHADHRGIARGIFGCDPERAPARKSRSRPAAPRTRRSCCPMPTW